MFLLARLALGLFFGYVSFKLLAVFIYAVGRLINTADEKIRRWIDGVGYRRRFPRL